MLLCDSKQLWVEIFTKCYCVARRKLNCKQQWSKDYIKFWFWDLLSSPELYSDWSVHNWPVRLKFKCSHFFFWLATLLIKLDSFSKCLKAMKKISIMSGTKGFIYNDMYMTVPNHPWHKQIIWLCFCARPWDRSVSFLINAIYCFTSLTEFFVLPL